MKVHSVYDRDTKIRPEVRARVEKRRGKGVVEIAKKAIALVKSLKK